MLPEDKRMLDELLAGRVRPSELSTPLLRRLNDKIDEIVLKFKLDAQRQKEEDLVRQVRAPSIGL